MSIETASIQEQINISQTIQNFTSTPEDLTAGDVSTSANIIFQLTTGATMDVDVSVYYVNSYG